MDQEMREKFTVPDSASIEAAVAAIEANDHRCVIVLGPGNRVVGTLSDGDVRKALLNRRLLSAPVTEIMNLNFMSLSPDDTARATVLSQRFHVYLFPVVNKNNELVDVVTTY